MGERALMRAQSEADYMSREQSAAIIAAAEASLEQAQRERDEKENARQQKREEYAALIDSKTAMKLINVGATKNAQGLALLIGLLRERLEELHTLPILEKEAKKLWRKTKKAEKDTVRINIMLRSLRNRHDEAVEFAAIHESDDEDVEPMYDEDIDMHNPEDIKAQMVKLAASQKKKAEFIEKARERLRELSVPLPERRFDLREPPRTARSDYDEEELQGGGSPLSVLDL